MNKKIRNATPLEYDSITFKSKLEVMAYKALKEYGFLPQYEPITYTLIDGFKPTVPFYERSKKTKALELNDKKIISIKYTPDFIVIYKNICAFIELKGMENDVYYIKKKLFRKYLEDNKDINPSNKYLYFEIHTKKELLKAIEIIKNS